MNSIEECADKYPDLKKMPVSECLKCTLHLLSDDDPGVCNFGYEHIRQYKERCGGIQMELA
jgi:hypothetical protein